MVSGMTCTSQGDLVMVQKRRLAIFNKQRQTITSTFTIPGAKKLHGIARQGDVMFITDYSNNNLIHVVRVAIGSMEHIKSIKTGLNRLYDIALANNTIWLTTEFRGLHKLTIDPSFNVTNSQLIAPPSSSFKMPIGITMHDPLAIVVCKSSQNVHIFDMSGNSVVPPVNVEGTGIGQLSGPYDVATDSAGRMYVAEFYQSRIVVYSPTGQFLTNLWPRDNDVEGGVGFNGRPKSLYLHGDILYVAAASFHLYVMELTYM